MANQQKVTYSDVGDNYDTKDPIKKLAQTAAASTAINLEKAGFPEVSETRGESAFVWSLSFARDKKAPYMASVIEGLGTKNLVADWMRDITGKTYYDAIAHDTIATIINDLISVGAKPLVIHAYWAVEDNSWLEDEERMRDLIKGWKDACNLSGATWGGGETPTMKQIVVPGTAEFGGSAVGIIKNEKELITDKRLMSGDRILLLKSSGINANGISLARAIAGKLEHGYGEKISDDTLYGEAILEKCHIYARLIQDLFAAGIDIHYLSYITGHGMRKVMRARGDFSYMIEKVFEPQPIFEFIQERAGLNDKDMYETYNMGQDYAIFLPEKDMVEALTIVKENGFEGINAGYIESGTKQVVIKEKSLTYSGSTLDLR